MHIPEPLDDGFHTPWLADISPGSDVNSIHHWWQVAFVVFNQFTGFQIGFHTVTGEYADT